MWVWIVGGIFLVGAFMVFALVSPVVVRLHYVRRRGTDRFTVDFLGLWGMLHKTWVLPGGDALGTAVDKAVGAARALEERSDGPPNEIGDEDAHAEIDAHGRWRTYLETGRRMAGLWKAHREMRRAVRRFFQKVTIRTWRTQVRIGTGEAASTGMLVGVLWSFFYVIAAGLAHRVRLNTPEARVDPDFRRRILEVEFEGIAQFRAGQAIRAGVVMVIVLWKEGLLWRSTLFKT